ncbi:MAG: 4,5-DOPA dioxygenase extradiol [Bacteroidia bacterium]
MLVHTMLRIEFLRQMIGGSLAFSGLKLSALVNELDSFQASPLMPVLFVGHGSPMNAIEQNDFSKSWNLLGKNLPTPRAILCISAHWETDGSFVTAMPNPKTIHDFGGFPQALFDVQYPAPGNPALAAEIVKMETARHISEDHSWGLDHGTWSVVKNMYPEANIPVLQLSLDYHLSAESHKELAASLKKLRERGVLIIGSGNLVHNLRMVDWHNPNNGYDWAVEADETFRKAISSEDWPLLLAKTNWKDALKKSVPTAEHYLPMIYPLAMKGKNEEIRYFNQQTLMGSISMTSFIIS